MDYIAHAETNPFGLEPHGERFVPGYGDTRADFHVVGDNPRVHGGLTTGIPFTDCEWSSRFFQTLERVGLVQSVDLAAGTVGSRRTFFSYLHMTDPGTKEPTATSYAEMEPYFDAELRAITAHVLVPVGSQATAHILRTCTATVPGDPPDMDSLHATEIQGSGWLVVPCKDPGTWSDDDVEQFADVLTSVQNRDYRQVSDLGRFIAGNEPYLVR